MLWNSPEALLALTGWVWPGAQKGLILQVSKCGPQRNSISTTWHLVKNASVSPASPAFLARSNKQWVQDPGWAPAIWVLTRLPRDSDVCSSLRTAILMWFSKGPLKHPTYQDWLYLACFLSVSWVKQVAWRTQDKLFLSPTKYIL